MRLNVYSFSGGCKGKMIRNFWRAGGSAFRPPKKMKPKFHFDLMEIPA
jgi:hypothetical protein